MIHLDAQSYLLRAGEPPTCGYLVEQGQLEVVIERADGPCVIAVLGPGEIVGEMALIDFAPRTASVRASMPTTLLPITAENLRKRLAVADPVLRLVLGTVLERYRAALRTIGSDGEASERNGASGLFAMPDQIATAARAELRFEEEFRSALRDGEIVVHYQPIVRLADGALAGFEALARWCHPRLGLVPPSVFIPLAEASDSSADLARVCLHRVAADLSTLRGSGPASFDPFVSVNISGQDLLTDDFIRDLGAIVATRGEVPGRFILELTESALIRSPEQAAAQLAAARRLGFKTAVDDFGTGYSSLNYVQMLPMDSLKIDKTFVQSLTESATTRSIVVSMLHLADALDMAVVAEGIETTSQRDNLQELGCEFGQGYLFGRPLPLAATLELCAAWHRQAIVPVAAIYAPAA